ncbi:hypothetical protein ACQEU5_17725 [Marinactinospora thermotolerans]|uniref:Uncharacterized protein n=1 Tax=Marinactinospora thermotolerans DSM 45154 TaxID=1122192 RepID=A0A1T4S624_9ACTN|nr:hypothetical protein [Marinactinospora thermotolerans]SKA23770.1 hypothetical protein SAMN02745673_03249 [Marinactinospora thermotolerans DSM 45154]
MQKEQGKRRKYAPPRLTEMGAFKKATGYNAINKLEIIFIWPRLFN